MEKSVIPNCFLYSIPQTIILSSGEKSTAFIVNCNSLSVAYIYFM